MRMRAHVILSVSHILIIVQLNVLLSYISFYQTATLEIIIHQLYQHGSWHTKFGFLLSLGY